MAFTGMCPYLKDARSCEKTVCECAEFTFPDRISRREVIYKYCGHPTGWRVCMLKAVMDGYYERRYSAEACSEDAVTGETASRNARKRKERA